MKLYKKSTGQWEEICVEDLTRLLIVYGEMGGKYLDRSVVFERHPLGLIVHYSGYTELYSTATLEQTLDGCDYDSIVGKLCMAINRPSQPFSMDNIRRIREAWGTAEKPKFDRPS